MPFTPFHFGLPALVFGILFLIKGKEVRNSRYLTVVSGFTIGSVIPDLQGMYSIFVNPSIKLHGFSHTLIGGILYAFIGIPCMYIFLGVSEDPSIDIKTAYMSTLAGIYLFHFIPDMFIWSDMHIFWPISNMSFGNENNYFLIAVYLSLVFVMGVLLTFLGAIRIMWKSDLNQHYLSIDPN